jgi:hypothetical protein
VKNSKTEKKSPQKQFVNDRCFEPYSKPKMIHAAQEMLCSTNLSEEGFLGAQAVLLLNGIL